MAKLNSQIDEQRFRRERAESASRRIRELLNEVTGILYKLYEKFQVRVINYKPVDDRVQMVWQLEIDLVLRKAPRSPFYKEVNKFSN